MLSISTHKMLITLHILYSIPVRSGAVIRIHERMTMAQSNYEIMGSILQQTSCSPPAYNQTKT